MNGFKIQAEAYRQVLKDNPDDREYIENSIMILDFLGNLNEDGLYKVFDSGAFNEITDAYCIQAMSNAGIVGEQAVSVIREMHCLFDTIRAADIIKG